MSFVYYAEKNIAQGIEAARSSIDVGFSKPVFDGNAELVFINDLFNQFGLKQTIRGDGFDALDENFYERQIASSGITYQF